MSRALTARMNALRVKPQAMPVPRFTFSVLAASHVAWVTELRKSSGVQTQSMPAASAEFACSASSSGVSPIAAIEMRSRAAIRATLLIRCLDGRVVERSPQIEAGEGAARAPLVGDPLELLGSRQLVHPVFDLDRAPDAEIAEGDDVLPGEVEHQEHLGRPAAHSLLLDQLGDHVLVRQVLDRVEVEAAVLDALCEIAEELDLGVGETGLAQRSRALAEQGLGGRRLAAEL